MINIYLFKFNKKINSTKLPTGIQGIHLTGALKEPCSLLHPVLELHTTTDLSQYNYCQVTELNRYYWIDDVIFNRGFYNLQCSVDVLASYKAAIGSTSGYCLRSSVLYNTDLSDSAWNITTDYRREISDSAAQWSWAGFNNGYYVVGVKGNNSTDINGVIYYQMTATEFSLFIRNFYTISGDNSFFGNLARGVADSIFNLSDFIVSCRWYPFPLYATTTKYDVYVGSYKVANLTAAVLKDYPIEVKTWTFTVPKHPQAAARGAYMNSMPFTKYEIKTPFGFDIPLSSYYMRDRTSITLSMKVDFTTGQAGLYVAQTRTPVGGQPGSYNDFTTYVKFGVDIPLSGTNVDVAGLGRNIVGGAVAAATGDFIGAAAYVGNAYASALPDPEPLGSTGGYAELTMTQPYLVAQFYLAADTDYTRLGRPCCQVTTPATIGSGFMMYQNVEFSAACTDEEIRMINGYFASGFYYE